MRSLNFRHLLRASIVPPVLPPQRSSMTAKRQLSIRTATETDLPAVLDLYGEAGFGGGHRMDVERARVLLARIAAYPDYRLYVVTEGDGRPVATYALLIMDNIAHDGRPLAIVEQVVVTRAHQGEGLGTFMMHHAMNEARAKDCYKLGLSSHTRFERAHAFYDKLGFKRHGYSFYVDLA